MLLPSKCGRRIKVVSFLRCFQFPNPSLEEVCGLVLKSQFATSNSLIALVYDSFHKSGWYGRIRWWRKLLHVAGARTQSKGRMRRSLVLRAFPCQPQLGLVQAISSLPNILMASVSESEVLLHFFSRLIFLRSLGHSKTIR